MWTSGQCTHNQEVASLSPPLATSWIYINIYVYRVFQKLRTNFYILQFIQSNSQHNSFACDKGNMRDDDLLTTHDLEPRSSSPNQLPHRNRPGAVPSTGMFVNRLDYFCFSSVLSILAISYHLAFFEF